MRVLAVFMLSAAVLWSAPDSVSAGERSDLENTIAGVVKPAMEANDIPGMAVGVVVRGRTYVFNYGVTSKASRQPVSDDTLFEIGSISKTFTATLASYAQVTGHLGWSDSASKYLPALQGSSFDHVSLLNLATHTSGGLPQQVPDEVKNDDQLMHYFQTWKPTCNPGVCRTYSNLSIGMLGLFAAIGCIRTFVNSWRDGCSPCLV